MEKNENGKPIAQHRVYFISDNINILHDKKINNERDLDLFMETFDYRSRYYEYGKANYPYKRSNKNTSFNNSYESRTARRIILSPRTFFRIGPLQYISGPSVLELGTPEIINVGTTKGKKNDQYYNVEAGFTIEESSSPFGHPTAQSFNLSITDVGKGKEVKTKYIETTGNMRKYTIKNLMTGVPYVFEGSAVDQYSKTYKTKIQITINPDGTVSSKKIKKES